MQTVARGTAKPAPTEIFEAERILGYANTRQKVRIDITPHPQDVIYVSSPNQRVDTIDQVGDEKPAYEGQRRSVPGAPVPWQGHQDKDGGNKREDGKEGVLHRQRT